MFWTSKFVSVFALRLCSEGTKMVLMTHVRLLETERHSGGWRHGLCLGSG